MNRRNFIYSFALGTIGLNFYPLYANNLPKALKPIDPWKATTPQDVITALYGNRKIIEASQEIKLKMPEVTNSGATTPLNIKSNLEAKKIIVMQNVNDLSLIGIFDVPKDAIVDYGLKLKLRFNIKGEVTVLIEDINGLLYKSNREFEVNSGGACEG